MTISRRTLLGLGLALLCVGCAPAKLAFPPLPPDQTATLSGSRFRASKPLTPDFLTPDIRVYLSTIDGVPTNFDLTDADRTMPVPAGVHAIGIKVDTLSGFSEFATQVTLEAGRSYVARAAASDGGVLTVWVEENGGGVIGNRIVSSEGLNWFGTVTPFFMRTK
jgi:hypothetical protein